MERVAKIGLTEPTRSLLIVGLHSKYFRPRRRLTPSSLHMLKGVLQNDRARERLIIDTRATTIALRFLARGDSRPAQLLARVFGEELYAFGIESTA